MSESQRYAKYIGYKFGEFRLSKGSAQRLGHPVSQHNGQGAVGTLQRTAAPVSRGTGTEDPCLMQGMLERECMGEKFSLTKGCFGHRE